MNKYQTAAKKYLSQAFGLNQRIKSKLGQIEELHDLVNKATVTYSDMPKNPNKGHSRMEDYICKIIDLESEINQDMIKLVELKKNIIGRIKAERAVVGIHAAAFVLEMISMPKKLKRPCSYPGCPNLTDGRYCPEHQQVNSNYEKYGRDKETMRRYGRAWKRIHDKYAMEHPFCELCYERGIIVPTEEIHHRKPLSEDGTHDRSNMIALCKSCHSQIHAKRGDYWGNHCGEGRCKSLYVKLPGNGTGVTRAKSRNEK